jgi:predicted HicB family RNase H-like nuclease
MEDITPEIRYMAWLNKFRGNNKHRKRVNFIKETYSLTQKEWLNSSKSFINKQKILRHTKHG